MARSLHLALFIALTLSITSSQVVPYDFYVFATFWLGSVCRTTQCLANQTSKAAPNFWMVHGLWPQISGGPNPAFCTNTTAFDPNLLGPQLLNMTNTFWVSANTSNDYFHTHEWDKHGTCWNDPINPHNETNKLKNYFSTSILYSISLSIYNILAMNSIVPRSEPYQLKDFSNVFNKQPLWKNNSYVMSCSYDKDGNQYFSDLYLCLDLNMKIMACPDGLESTFPNVCNAGTTYYTPLNVSQIEMVTI